MIWWDIVFGVFVSYMKIFAFVSLLCISWLHLTVPLNSKLWHHTINFASHMRWDGPDLRERSPCMKPLMSIKAPQQVICCSSSNSCSAFSMEGFQISNCVFVVWCWCSYHFTFWDSILMKHCRRDRGLSHNISKHSKVQLCKFLFSL